MDFADVRLEITPAALARAASYAMISAPDETPELDFEARMMEKYEGFTQGQLLDAHLTLRKALNELTREYYAAEFAAGRYETHLLTPDEHGYRAIPNLPGELSSLHYEPGGETRLVRLPRAGFEEAYALSEEASWILQRETEVKRDAQRSSER